MIIENEMVKRGSILILIKEQILIKEREILSDFNIALINNHLNFESLQAYFTQFSFVFLNSLLIRLKEVFLNSPLVAALYFYPY